VEQYTYAEGSLGSGGKVSGWLRNVIGAALSLTAPIDSVDGPDSLLAIIVCRNGRNGTEYNMGCRGGRPFLAFHPNLNSNALAAP
jgi:hypothetical protein